jgi:hypothetical protein
MFLLILAIVPVPVPVSILGPVPVQPFTVLAGAATSVSAAVETPNNPMIGTCSMGQSTAQLTCHSPSCHFLCTPCPVPCPSPPCPCRVPCPCPTLCPCPCPAFHCPDGGWRYLSWRICCCCRQHHHPCRNCPCPVLLLPCCGSCCGFCCACCCGRLCHGRSHRVHPYRHQNAMMHRQRCIDTQRSAKHHYYSTSSIKSC